MHCGIKMKRNFAFASTKHALKLVHILHWQIAFFEQRKMNYHISVDNKLVHNSDLGTLQILSPDL